jgi:deoxyribonuclease-1-like protein
MSRFWKTVLLLAVIFGGGWALVNREKIDNPQVLLHQISSQFKQISFPKIFLLEYFSGNQPDPPPTEPAIRIASFKLSGFGGSVHDEQVLPLLAEICGRFDVIALRGLGSEAEYGLSRLVATIDSQTPGKEYFFITDQGQISLSDSTNAILFNASTLELEQLNWYLAQDPQHLLRRAPLVAWFRTRVGERAFTFTLVNAELRESRPDKELVHIRDLFRSIRNDGRQEDDVVLVGDFGHWNQSEPSMERTSGLGWVVSNVPTDLLHTRQDHNIIFNPLATTEFTGRSGVLDFLRVLNLRLGEAQQLSDQLPIWAEFSIYEGG